MIDLAEAWNELHHLLTGTNIALPQQLIQLCSNLCAYLSLAIASSDSVFL